MRRLKVKWTIHKNETFVRRFVYKNKQTNQPINLTGWSARLQFRDTESLASPVLLNVPLTIDAQHVIEAQLSVSALSLVTFEAAVWDIVLTDTAGKHIRLIAGTAIFSDGVTYP